MMFTLNICVLYGSQKKPTTFALYITNITNRYVLFDRDAESLLCDAH
jgi:hypothetical protein